MIKHYLREIRDLCSYSVAGIGNAPAALTGLVFDANDWCLRAFVVERDSLYKGPVIMPPTCFRSLDDERRELHFEADDETLASPEPFRPEALANSTWFDAVAFIGTVIDGRDGPAGHVADLLINVDLWVLRYFVVDTDRRRVLTDVEWASSLKDRRGHLHVDLPAEAIATAPRYERLNELCQGDEEALYRHYTRSAYRDQGGTI